MMDKHESLCRFLERVLTVQRRMDKVMCLVAVTVEDRRISEWVFRAKAEKNSNLPIMNGDDRHDGIRA